MGSSDGIPEALAVTPSATRLPESPPSPEPVPDWEPFPEPEPEPESEPPPLEPEPESEPPPAVEPPVAAEEPPAPDPPPPDPDDRPEPDPPPAPARGSTYWSSPALWASATEGTVARARQAIAARAGRRFTPQMVEQRPQAHTRFAAEAPLASGRWRAAMRERRGDRVPG